MNRVVIVLYSLSLRKTFTELHSVDNIISYVRDIYLYWEKYMFIGINMIYLIQ